MNEKRKIVISVYDLLKMILGYLPVIVCWSVFCCLMLVYYKVAYKEPVFVADTSIYVYSRTADNEYERLDVSDLDVSQQMAKEALGILGSEQVAEQVLINLEGDAEALQTMTTYDLLNMVSIYKQDESLEITFTASGSDPYVVCDVANAYRETAINEIRDRLMAKGIQTAREAVIPLAPSGRPSSFYGAVGLFLGLISSIGLVTLMYVVRLAKRIPEDVGEI